MSNFDAQIAAIARAKSYLLARRNIEDFERCGVDLINPFDDRSGWGSHRPWDNGRRWVNCLSDTRLRVQTS